MSKLTVSQLAAICTRNPTPPWHLKDLLTIYKLKTLSVSTLIDEVGRDRVIFYIQVRDLSIFKSVNNLEDLKSKWISSAPSKATLVKLSQMLGPLGASIVYLDQHNWGNSIGIAGTFASLTLLNVAQVSDRNLSGVKDVATGAGLATAGGLAIAGGLSATSATAEAASFALLVGASGGTVLIAAGVIIGAVGIYELCTDEPAPAGATPPPPPGMDAGAPPTQFGPPPPGIDPSNPPVTPIDPTSLPDTPPTGKDSKDGGKEGKDVTDKDKDGSKDGGKEGKEVTDNKDKDGSKEGSKDVKEDKEGKESKDDKEVEKPSKEGKEGKDSKEATDTKDKDSKEETDNEPAGLAGSEGSAMYAKTDAANTPAAWLVEGGSTKPATLLTRSPLV